MTDDVIARSVAEAIVHAPHASIDLADWVFTLTDSEYQACSKNHIAASASMSNDGKRMSINVEHVGTLLIQHYVEDGTERAHVRLTSVSDSIGPDIASKTKVIVVWEFRAEPDGENTRFINSVEVRSTPDYFEAIQKRGVSFSDASNFAQQALSAHNLEETPLFAKDVERKAIAGRWI